MDATHWVGEIEALIEEKHLLKHPFYKAWSQGNLSQACLTEYANEYYHHVRAFPTYLSALHAHTDDENTRKEILKNLIEEEAGNPNHPELWRQFACSLGANESSLNVDLPCAAIKELISLFRSICQKGSVAEGIAALYAYESQIPSICLSKIEGLKRFYGLKDPMAWHYFSVHIAADKEHAAVERELLIKHLLKEEVCAVKQAVQKILDALWNFLSHMSSRYGIQEMAC